MSVIKSIVSSLNGFKGNHGERLSLLGTLTADSWADLPRAVLRKAYISKLERKKRTKAKKEAKKLNRKNRK